MEIMDIIRLFIAVLGLLICVVGTVAFIEARRDIAALHAAVNGRRVIAESAQRSTALDLLTGLILAPQMVMGLLLTEYPQLADPRAWLLAAVFVLQLLRMVSQRLTRHKLLRSRRRDDG